MGLETAKQLLERGMRVVMTGRDLEALETARNGLGKVGREAVVALMDVANPTSIAAAFAAIRKQVGTVDVLVNNAAVLRHENDEPLAIPLEGYRQTLETNLLGVIETCRVFVPAMAERRYGRVVNVSSGAGQLSSMSTYAPAYSLSKAALNAFTRILAETYRDRNVLVNAVDPGWVRTDMGGRAAPRSVQQGVDTTVWLATLSDNGPTSGFFHDRQPIAW
jgi:NAD(P)-dependent dehydrogenase (short-subunit alcohol dehydrogenase family)